MRPNRNFQPSKGLAEQNSQNNFNNTRTLSLRTKSDEEVKYTSELAMVLGISLLVIGTVLSNTLLNNGLEGITLGFFAAGFSMIFYGVSEDNK